MNKVTVEIPHELVARVDRALKAEGLEVRSFSLGGLDYNEVSNRIGGAPGVPRVIAHGGPEIPILMRSEHYNGRMP